MVSLMVNARPIESDVSNLGNCTFLGSTTGRSGYGKNPNWESIAKTYAINRAKDLGATHVAMKSKLAIGVFNGEMTLDAYRCPPGVPSP